MSDLSVPPVIEPDDDPVLVVVDELNHRYLRFEEKSVSILAERHAVE